MRRNKLSPIKSKLNSVKKTKVQFSTRLSSCLGEHQSQEFFERLNITRQSGICSKNKNNSFGENKSHSFRQTLQLNIPFIADLSDFKELCICYPVHFFRRKLHSYDNEDSRLASVRVYYPASRMKYGNEFKVSMDLKKRYHLQPHQYEFVAYSNLLTLSLEDLALAVFRAKSLSEKFKIVHSLPIPKILLSSNNFTSQIGTPIFIGTERIYSRLSKLIACLKNTSFPLNHSFSTNSDSDLYLKKCVLKWVGLCDFLPLSSRLVFVRRVSGDSGDTLGCSILNSPGPKIRRSRIKEGDRLSIRLKQAKLECTENEDLKAKLLIEPTVQKIKNLNSRFQNNKRPRGRPKKSSDSQDRIPLKFPDDNNNTNLAVISPNIIEEKVKPESLHLKTESISNSLIDSTSEEKYSVQLSTCSTPDTIKSRSPLALNGSITTTNSTAPISQVTTSVNDKSLIIKNKRGRPRKYPSNIQEDSNIRLTLSKNKSGNFEVLGKCQETVEPDDAIISRKRSSNNSCSSEPDSKISRIVDHNSSLSDGDMSSQVHAHTVDSSNQSRKSHTTYYNGQCLNLLVHSMWKPLHHPLPPPEPIVPFIKLISSTGLNRTTQLNIKTNCVKQERLTHSDSDVTVNNPVRQSSSCKTDNFYQNFSKELSSLTNFKTGTDFVHDNHLSSNHSKLNSKENIFNDEIDIFGSNQQYLLQNNIFNQLMMTSNPSSLSHNNNNNNNSSINNNNTNNNLGILSPYFNSVLNSHNNGSFNNLVPPVSVNLNSMFPSNNTSNALQLPNLSLPSQLFYDTTAQLLFSNNSQMGGGSFSQNPVLAACASLNHPAGLQHPTYNHILLANRFEPTNPDLSWNNGFQWKF